MPLGLEQGSKLFSSLTAWKILLVEGEEQWGDENKGWSGKNDAAYFDGNTGLQPLLLWV